jgi:hypothetical protein
MAERRYSDEEAEQIFARASEAEQETPMSLQTSAGRTLADLQAIAREAGLSPELVARAARSLDQSPPVLQRFLGLPLAVGRSVSLQRRMTDAEWEQLVVQLRETFDARGVTRIEGSLRSWTNGNLQVLLEPEGDGHRVRFRTLNGQSRALMLGGLGMLGVGAVSAIAGFLFPGGQPLAEMLSNVSIVGLLGAGMLGIGAARLPSWARLRRHQMDELSDRLIDG